MIGFDFKLPQLLCSVGLITGTGGAGKVSRQKQTSESGTDIYKGLAQFDPYANSFGGAPTIANFDPKRTTQLPQTRYAQVGIPQTPNMGGGGVTGQQGAVPTATPQVNNQPRNNVAFAQSRQVQQGPMQGQAPMQGQGGAVPTASPQYNTAFNPAQGQAPPARGSVPYPNAGQQSATGGPPTISWDEKRVKKQLKKGYPDGATFENVPGVSYTPTPEELQFQFDQQRLQDMSGQGLPTSPRTQDYGDTFRLPEAQSVFTPDVYQQLQQLGFTGQNLPQAQAQGQYGDIAQSGAASAQAAQIGTSDREFQQQSQRLYDAQFAPQQQELSRQQEIAERDQKARLASAGLATSGTGIAQQTELGRDFQQRLSDTSRQAATQASAQAFGMQQEQRLQNAQNQQQTSLANAGFSQQAQLQNASNLLTRQGQVDQNYLAAIGMNQEQANGVRDDFLATLGLEAADLERVDAGQRQNVEMMFNNYINLLTTISNIGRYSTGSATSTGPGGLISY